MKTLSFVLFLSALSGANAGERILLDREEITASSANLVLVRTAATPAKVKISLPVDAKYMECVDGWVSQRIRNHSNPDCMDSRNGAAGAPTYRLCSVKIETCRGYAPVPTVEWSKVVVKFRDSARLVGGEETYALTAAQNAKNEEDFVYDLRPISIGADHRIAERSGDVLGFQVFNPRFIVK